MAIIQRGDHTLNGQGFPLTRVPADTVQSANDLANAMYASGHYPAGLSPCFTSGINGDWADYGGICPFWGGPECSCDTDMTNPVDGVFYEMLADMGITAEQWHAMDSDEKQDRAAAPVDGEKP